MIKYFHRFLYIVSFSLLFLFLYISFFSEQYRGLQNIVATDADGYFSVTVQSGSLLKRKIERVEDFDFEEKGAIFLDKVSKFDGYYSTLDGASNYVRKTTPGGDALQIGEGEFLFNFKDKTKTHMVESNAFTIETLSKGSLYIKNSSRRIGFYSFDGIFKVKFRDMYTGDFSSSFYIFPGMYAKGTQFRKQPGVDEDSTVENELFYINNLQLTGKKDRTASDGKMLMYSFNFIYNTQEVFSTEGVHRSLKKLLGMSSDFLDMAWGMDLENKKDFRKKYVHFEELKNYQMPLFEELQGYFAIFLNKPKKVVYYKNLLLADLAKIVVDIDSRSKVSKEIKVYDEDYLQNIHDNLAILYEISPIDHQEFLAFMEDYYYFYTEIYATDFSTKFYITKLYIEIKEDKERVQQTAITHGAGLNNMYLTHLFSMYNRGEMSRKSLNIGLIQYIIASSSDLDSSDPKSFYYYYYAYNKILKNHIQIFGIEEKGFEDIVEVGKSISFINGGYFDTLEVKKGMLYINVEIIESIINYLYELYFEVDRDGKNLLILKDKELDIDDAMIMNLKQNLKTLFDYQYRSAVLDINNENELSLLQKYERLKDLSEEYFQAITNNDEYRNAKVYDSLNEISAYNRHVFVAPNEDQAKTYLSNFVQVDISKAQITVKEEAYYDVKNISVGEDVISFELYPLEFNKLTNIKKSRVQIENLRDIVSVDIGEEFQLKDPLKLTVDELYDYLIERGNIEVSKSDITIPKGTYYQLEDINVGGVKYSFHLFPHRENSVSHVMEGLGVTYKLDNIKPKSDSKDSVGETESYKNFFVNLLMKNKEAPLITINSEGKNIQKDSIEVNIFKNDFLFGKYGDFTEISDRINLQFDNVDVIYKEGKYTTHINKIEMLAAEDIEKTERGESVQAELSAEYVIASKRSYFKNIFMKFYFIRNKKEDIRYDFYNQKLQVLGDVEITDFDIFYKNLWTDYKEIARIHLIKERIIGQTELKNLRYIPASRDATIAYPYKNDVISISFQEGAILKIKYRDDIFEGKDLENIEKIFKLFL